MGQLLGAVLAMAAFGALAAWILRKLTALSPIPSYVVAVPLMVVVGSWLLSLNEDRYTFWDAVAIYGAGGMIALAFLILAERRRRPADPQTTPAGAIENQSKRSPFFRWQSLAIVLTGLGVFALVKAGPWIAGFLGGKYAAETLLSRPYTQSDLEAILAGQGTRLYRTIKEELPNEYGPLMDGLVAISNETNDNVAARQRAYDLTSAIRRKYAPNVRSTPDSALLLALRAQLDLLNTLHAEGTPETCSDFVSRGALALGTPPDDRYLSRMDDAAVALIKAIGAATGGGQPVQPPSEDDWTRLAALFLDNGGTSEELDIVANADGRDGRLCSATLRFFKAVVEIQGDVGRRIRAEMVYSLATS